MQHRREDELKKWISPAIAIMMMATLLMAEVIRSNDVIANRLLNMLTEGNAAFTVRTVTYNGPYGPRNAGVIWVTDSNNQFVKTIKIWANNYRYTLIRWIASSSQNMTGAITSASLNSHQLHNVSWDGKNYQNVAMPDGEYKFNVEFTEHNAHAGNMGKYKQVAFTKGPDPVTLTIPNESYFQNMSLNWTPVIQNGTISGIVSDEDANPLPGAQIAIGALNASSDNSGFYSFSVPPGSYNLSCTAPGYQDFYQNNIEVNAAQTTSVNIPMATVNNADITEPIPMALFNPVYPNPGKGYTKFSFFSPNQAAFKLQIFNARGQMVYSHEGYSQKGWQEINWNGKNTNGRACSNGIYHAKLSYKDQVLTRKFTVIR